MPVGTRFGSVLKKPHIPAQVPRAYSCWSVVGRARPGAPNPCRLRRALSAKRTRGRHPLSPPTRGACQRYQCMVQLRRHEGVATRNGFLHPVILNDVRGTVDSQARMATLFMAGVDIPMQPRKAVEETLSRFRNDL